jgi:hypothetical protein
MTKTKALNYYYMFMELYRIHNYTSVPTNNYSIISGSKVGNGFLDEIDAE